MKVVSDSPGLVNFAVGLAISILNVPDGQMNFLGGNSGYRRTVTMLIKMFFFGLVEMTFGLVRASNSLPEWQAVKLTFFAPCIELTHSRLQDSGERGSKTAWGLGRDRVRVPVTVTIVFNISIPYTSSWYTL